MLHVALEEHFTSGTWRWKGVNEIRLPKGWTEFAYRESRRYEQRPEVCVDQFEFPNGNTYTALKVFSMGQHYALVGIHVAVDVGTRYQFKVPIWHWSSQEDDPHESVGGSMRSRIGVCQIPNRWELPDGIGPLSPDAMAALERKVVWNAQAPGIRAEDQFVQHLLEFTAAVPEVILVIQSNPEWGVKHNDIWVPRAVCLEAAGSPENPDEERFAALEKRIRAQGARLQALIDYLQGVKL